MTTKKRELQNKFIALNRKAHFNYEIVEEIEAGLVLLGSEVKSLREAKVSIADAYVAEIDNALYLVNAHINEYKGSNRFNHDPKRPRKLLLHRKEMNKLKTQITTKSFSAVPTKLFFNKKNFAKVTIGIGKGKKLYDKRESIKKRDLNRSQARGEE